ncbi:MAG TPA: beta-ketoacyl-ACP synthase 3, partial [Conexibacter sp.]|nr:beta-ketoacyl-ACP synthase 3 [Conexibacter sp.]
PRRSVSNDEVAARIGKTDEWIYTRTGIRARRHAEPDESLTQIAAPASRDALERAEVAADALDLVVVGTLTPDDRMPNAAAALAHELGAFGAGTIEVNAACSGFLTALSIGAAHVETGRAEHVLVVGADFISRITDPDSKQTAMLFADGAGAVVLAPTPAGAGRIGPVLLRHDAASPEFLYLSREGGATIEMDGHATFKHAVNRIVEVTQETVAAAGMGLADVDLFVYHQANSRILKAVAERLDLDPARVIDCIESTGNMSAASVPYALAVAERDGRLRDGARVLLAAFGGGFTWGGALIEWGRGDA